MSAKHPERKPVDEVEGVIYVDELEGHKLVITPQPTDAFREFLHAMCTAAERTIRKRKQALPDQEAA